MRIEIVVAMTPELVIGKNGVLPWPRIDGDLARFYSLTAGNYVAMGRRTWQSLPHEVRPLKHRINIVISRHMQESKDYILVDNPNKVLELACTNRVFIIGGADIYKQFLPFADVMHVTWIYQNYKGDTVFPINWTNWKEVQKFKDKTKWGVKIAYSTYHKKYNVAKPALNLA